MVVLRLRCSADYDFEAEWDRDGVVHVVRVTSRGATLQPVGSPAIDMGPVPAAVVQLQRQGLSLLLNAHSIGLGRGEVGAVFINGVSAHSGTIVAGDILTFPFAPQCMLRLEGGDAEIEQQRFASVVEAASHNTAFILAERLELMRKALVDCFPNIRVESSEKRLRGKNQYNQIEPMLELQAAVDSLDDVVSAVQSTILARKATKVSAAQTDSVSKKQQKQEDGQQEQVKRELKEVSARCHELEAMIKKWEGLVPTTQQRLQATERERSANLRIDRLEEENRRLKVLVGAMATSVGSV